MSQRLRSIALAAILAWVAPALAQDEALPEPLGLDQALGFADGHPRNQLDPAQAMALPRRLPLYLACHELAFGAAAIGDDARNRPLDALLNPVDAQRLEILVRFLDTLLADLSFADLLLFGVAEGVEERFVVLGQIRPTTAQTLYRDDLVGPGVEQLGKGVLAESLLSHDYQAHASSPLIGWSLLAGPIPKFRLRRAADYSAAMVFGCPTAPDLTTRSTSSAE